jgi:hypothetical protein
LDAEEHAYQDPALTEIHAAREKSVRDDVARRLRRVCSHCDEEDFRNLVRKIADQKVRDERKPVW